MSDIVLNVNSACNNAMRKGLQDRWASLLSQFQDYLRIMRKSTTLFFSIIVAFYVNTWSKNVMLFTVALLVHVIWTSTEVEERCRWENLLSV